MHWKSPVAIVGLGLTGQSCLAFFEGQVECLMACDTRETLPQLKALQTQYPLVQFEMGTLACITKANTVVISPGVPQEALALFDMKDKIVLSDIDVFMQMVKVPVIGVTGTNGKSTVVTLLGECAKACKLSVGVGGNLGPPALSLLEGEPKDVYVLELSSFQLMHSGVLPLSVGVFLNCTPDHLDWHGGFEGYCQAKHRIYQGAQACVFNASDANTTPADSVKGTVLSFGKEGQVCSAQTLNQQAVLATARHMGWDASVCQEAMDAFQGLPHRFCVMHTQKGVSWVNDSKATNVGATLKAFENLKAHGVPRAAWIAGGQGKGQDFALLKTQLPSMIQHVFLIGEAREMLQTLLEAVVPVTLCDTLEEAMVKAHAWSLSGDWVLLSPACASFDMFKSFEHRGTVFESWVREH